MRIYIFSQLPFSEMSVLTLKGMTAESWNYYEVLDVDPSATQDRIFEAYQSAKETYSLANPKILQVFSHTEALDWMNVIEEAYTIIGHPNSRRQYDVELRSRLPNHTFIESPRIKTQLTKTNYNPKLSYTVDPQLEKQIAQQDIFDGLFLKKIREYKNIDLNEFSSITCIALRHLYAIENNNFSVLPAAVFVRGYIIQYCRILDLPEDKVVPSFINLLKNG